MSPRYAGSPRRWHRNREASETRCAQTADASLSDFGTSDVAPSTGIHCNGNGHFTSNGNGNGRCAGKVNGNGNGRCAGKGNCSARMEPLSGRRLLTASMLTGLASLRSTRATRQQSL